MLSTLLFLLAGCSDPPKPPPVVPEVVDTITPEAPASRWGAMIPLTTPQRFRVLQALAPESLRFELRPPASAPVYQPFSHLDGVYQLSALETRELWDTTLEVFQMEPNDPFVACGSDRDCAFNAATAFAEEAWRFPLDDEQRAEVEAHFDTWWDPTAEHPGLWFKAWAASSPWAAFRVELPTAEASTQTERPELNTSQLANRLAFGLWDGPPDASLRAIGASDQLATSEGVREVTRQMLADPRFDLTLSRFHREWLGLGKLDARSVDASTYFPDIGLVCSQVYIMARLRVALATELDLFVRSVIREGEATWGELLTGRRWWAGESSMSYVFQEEADEVVPWSDEVVAATVRFGEAAQPEQFHALEMPEDRRAGLLTQPAVLTLFAGTVQPSPVKRGAWILERMLCEPPRTPPAGVPALPGQSPAVTNRERYATHAESPSCSGCHEPIDEIGFTFEHYDALGRWRDTDGGQPVDSSGALQGTDVDGEVADALELSSALAQSAQARACYATWWWRYLVGSSPAEEDAAELAQVVENFHSSAGHIPTLIEDITATSTFRSHLGAP